MSSDPASKNLSEASPRFMTTRWTVMGDAGDVSRRDAAWDHFCAAYWYPVYSFIRRRGDSPEDASDLTQAFFGKLIEQDWLAKVERRETRFSTLLIIITMPPRSAAAEKNRCHSIWRGRKVGSAQNRRPRKRQRPCLKNAGHTP
jgi:hypothetical protein